MNPAQTAVFTPPTWEVVKDIHQTLTIPPMAMSKSSVRINTMLGLWYTAVAITARLLSSKESQKKVQRDTVWGHNRKPKAMLAAKLKTQSHAQKLLY